MFRLWCILIGYVCGVISTSYIVGNVRGIDIREHGSGNAGTTNTLRVLGRRAGGIVLAGDVLKCFVAMLISWLVFKNQYPDYKYLIRIYAAAGTILGHDYPFFLKFRGGKGVACFAGMIAFFYPGIIPAEIAIFFGIFFLTHYVSLGSMFLGLGFLAQVIIFGQFGFFNLQPEQLTELYLVTTFLVLLSIFQHRKNIVNLILGQEKKTYLSKKHMKAEIEEEKEKEEKEKKEEKQEKEEKEEKDFAEEYKESVEKEIEFIKDNDDFFDDSKKPEKPDIEKTLKMDPEELQRELDKLNESEDGK